MVGQTFGPYRIVEELGVGGMGVVYRAQDTRLHRAVALKFLPADLSTDPRAIDRLLREAQAASALNHPNICTVFDVGEGDGRHFIVMELLDGMTLEHRAAGRPQPVAQLIRWGTQLADALDAAHERGIIHRDLKPANIFVTSREDVKILDFGIAKFIDARSGAADADSASATKTSAEKQLLTIPGSAIGTAAYMSPEQVRGEPLDRRTDLFSLGTVFYELSTGRRPFEGASPAAVFAAILHATPVPPMQANPELPARLASIIDKLLEKEAALRYQHANEVRTDLERLKRDTAHTGTESAASRTDGHPRTRRRALRIGAALGAVASLALAGFVFFRPAPVPVLTERDTLLLADVVNNTGEEVFDTTLTRALALHLEQSPFLALVPDAQVRETLQYMGRPSDARVEGDVARDVCQRRGAAAILATSIQTLGSEYVLDFNATNCATGDILAREQVQAPRRDDVLPGVGRAAARLREKLGESLSSVRRFAVPAEDVTTSSLEAFRAFSLGERERAKGAEHEGLAFYRRALELDPQFALAYQRLATIHRNEGNLALAATNARAAFDRRQRVSMRERMYIEARYYTSVTGELDKAVETLRVLAEMYPRDWSAANQLAFNSALLGQLERALAAALEAARRGPDHPLPQANLANHFLRMDRIDEAQAQAETVLKRWKLGGGTLFEVGFLRRDFPLMDRARVAAGARALLLAEARASAFEGKWTAARGFYKRAAESPDEAQDTAAVIAAEHALLAVFFGDLVEGLRVARIVLALPVNPYSHGVAAAALAFAESRGDSLRVIEQISREYPTDTLVQGVVLPSTRAALALRAGQASSAVEHLSAAGPYDFAVPARGMLPSVSAYLRGQAYLALADGARAAAEFQKIVQHRGLNAVSPLWPLAQLGLARAYAAAGDNTRARKAYDDLFQTWRDADLALLPAREARREYDRLSAPR